EPLQIAPLPFQRHLRAAQIFLFHPLLLVLGPLLRGGPLALIHLLLAGLLLEIGRIAAPLRFLLLPLRILLALVELSLGPFRLLLLALCRFLLQAGVLGPAHLFEAQRLLCLGVTEVGP